MNTAKFFFKLSIAVILLFIFNISNSYAMSFEKKFEFCQITSLWLPVLFENAGVSGRDICSVSGGTMCSYVDNIGEGICYAGGGGTMCSYVDSIAQGICYASKSTNCSYANSISDELCKIAGICNTNNIIDIINGVIGVCGTKVLHYGFSR